MKSKSPEKATSKCSPGCITLYATKMTKFKLDGGVQELQEATLKRLLGLWHEEMSAEPTGTKLVEHRIGAGDQTQKGDDQTEGPLVSFEFW